MTKSSPEASLRRLIAVTATLTRNLPSVKITDEHSDAWIIWIAMLTSDALTCHRSLALSCINCLSVASGSGEPYGAPLARSSNLPSPRVQAAGNIEYVGLAASLCAAERGTSLDIGPDINARFHTAWTNEVPATVANFCLVLSVISYGTIRGTCRRTSSLSPR